jgi:broad specificity phosphatase PhoE
MAVRITYFVHGTTTDNEQDLATGWLPGELSAKGVQQSKDLGPLVANQQFDAVYCSDLQRAVDSAELNFGEKYAITPDARLRECNYGDFNGKPVALFKADMTKFVDVPFPNGESYKDVEQRMRAFVEFLKADHDGQHIALVAHEGPQLALDVILKGKSWQQAMAENWRNTKSWQPGWEYIIP